MFFTTLQQVAILLIFIIIGYVFRKKNVITDGGRKVLAGLLVNFFAPAYSISSLSTVVNVNDIMQYSLMLLIGTAVAVLGIFLAIPFSHILGKDKFHRNIFKYALAFGNIGYFGYPLVYGVFGAVARAQMMIFCLPMSILIASYGYYILTKPTNEMSSENLKALQNQRKRLNLSFLYNPPMIGTYIGIALGLLSSGLNFKIPKFFTDIFTIAGNCQSAPAMLITGAVLASVPIKSLFSSFKSYVISAIRLLVFPCAFAALFALIYLCGWRDQTFMQIAFIAIVAVSMPVGMNVVVYPESAGMDSTEGAKTCFISYVLALITLPMIYTALLGVLNVSF